MSIINKILIENYTILVLGKVRNIEDIPEKTIKVIRKINNADTEVDSTIREEVRLSVANKIVTKLEQ